MTSHACFKMLFKLSSDLTVITLESSFFFKKTLPFIEQQNLYSYLYLFIYLIYLRRYVVLFAFNSFFLSVRICNLCHVELENKYHSLTNVIYNFLALKIKCNAKK